MKLWQRATSLLANLFGKFTWESPTWLLALKHSMLARPRYCLSLLVSVFAILLLTCYSYEWYKNRPQPIMITAQIEIPAVTPNERIQVPQPVSINFGIEGDEFTAKSVAPLNLIGQTVTKGIHITPSIAGTWHWDNDSHLLFTPDEEWQAGQEYTIDFDKTAFAPKTKLERYHYSFTTRSFRAKISHFRFYQDPVNPNQHEAVATITFNYPVATKSFENNTALTLQGFKDYPAKDYKFQVNYDTNKRTAYLHSENIQLFDVTRYLKLTIQAGVKPLIGGNELAKKIQEDILIPDVGSYFKVDNINTAIVHDQNDKPEQVLNVATTIGVKDTELSKSLHVYLLPQDYPAEDTGTMSALAKPNYQWQSVNEVTPAILAQSTALTLQPIATDRDYATLHSYVINAPASRYIYVKLDQGTPAFGDYKLSQDYATIVMAPAYPTEINFLHKGALLALDSEKKLSLVVRGLPAVKVSIARVLPDDVNQLVTQTNGQFANPTFLSDSFDQNNISAIFSEIHQFDASDPAKAQYFALDVGKYLAAKQNVSGPQGLFLLHATGWDPKLNQAIDVSADRLILVTNLGFIVKDNVDGTHDVYVQSITTGKPAVGVNVSILGKNGLPFLSRLTDVKGHANFPGLQDYINEREPTAYLASQGADVAFIPYQKTDRQLNYSRFDTGGVYTSEDQQALTAYVFSDRGIYRPGDTAHIGMIVKQAYAEPETAGIPLEVIITDPRGMNVLDQKLALSDSGLLSLDFPTHDVSLTGDYAVNLYIVKDTHASSLLGSTTIRVSEFLPDRMHITAKFSSESSAGWISPDDLAATVNLENLYGTAATNRMVKANISLAPYAVHFANYPDYHFVDPLSDDKKSPEVLTDTLTEQQTDTKGNATFDLNLQRFNKATYKLSFFAEGFEAEGGRSVTTQINTIVSPLTYLVGYKADGDLRFIKQDVSRSVNLIAVNPALKQIALSNLQLQWIALRPVTTLVKNADGTYQYQSIMQTNVIRSMPFNISQQGTNLPLIANSIGDFAVRLLDPNGTELSRFNYSVVGASQTPLAKNAELSVKLNKTEYQPGETIELQVTSPYAGAGLITIERDKVYAAEWFKADSTTSLQKIQLPADFQGNGYVNVTFVRDWNSPDIFLNPLSYSVMPFTVNANAKTIHLNLSAPTLAMPGEPLKIQYSADKPSKIILYGVDEGILQVASYVTPDPLAFFFQKKALQVTTEQTVDQILPKFSLDRELSAAGGDGGEEAAPILLNPFKRKTDLPVVFWSGILDADTTPREFTYNIPDYFNGSLRVMAVAVAANAVGATQNTTQVRGDFVITPNVPTFATPGDEFTITATVANNLKNATKHTPITVTLDVTPGLSILGDAKQTITIDPGQEGTISYQLKATAVLGSAKMTFTAAAANKQNALSATLSVRPASPFMTSVISGVSNATLQKLTLDRELYAEKRNVSVNAATNPLILVFGLQRYLDNFPYGCTEQLVSKVLPLLALYNKSDLSDKLTIKKVAATVQMLAERQMSSGAFSYWPTVGDYASNTFASIYAMHFLTEANEQGFDVPKPMLTAGIAYLQSIAAQTPTSLQQARLIAYAIYVLTRNEIVTTNYLTHLQNYLDQDKENKWHHDITSAYIAATYALLKSQPDADRIIQYYQINDARVNEPDDFYNKSIANAEYLYLLAKQFPNLLAKLDPKLILSLVESMNTDQINTVLSGYTSLALGSYGQATTMPTSSANLTMSELLTSGESKPLTQTNSMSAVSIDQLAKSISIHNDTKQAYFYQLIQAGYDKNLTNTPISQQIEITREYRDAQGNIQGNSITQANLGDEIEVRIMLRAINHTELDNIAIVDLLPGGFELVSGSISASNMDYTDAREDRIIFFGSAGEQAKEIRYRIKAINKGKFTIPPILAASMYDPAVQGRGISGEMEVE